jgi:hypothetical protein
MMDTEAVSLSQDIHDPIAKKQAKQPRRVSKHIQNSDPRVEKVDDIRNQVDCQAYSYTGLPDEEHEVCVL